MGDFDPANVDHAWVQSTVDVPKLRQVIHFLSEEQPHYPRLLAAAQRRLEELDPTAKEGRDFADLEGWSARMKREDARLQRSKVPSRDLPPVRGAQRKQLPRGETQQDVEEETKAATQAKDHGNACFQKKEFNQALKFYAVGLAHARRANIQSLLAVLHTNRATVLLKMNKFAQAETECTAALVADPLSFKARLRRGHALLSLKRPREAAEDLRKSLELARSGGGQRFLKLIQSTLDRAEQDLKTMPAEPVAAAPAKMRRLPIEEVSESDSEEEQPKPKIEKEQPKPVKKEEPKVVKKEQPKAVKKEVAEATKPEAVPVKEEAKMPSAAPCPFGEMGDMCRGKGEKWCGALKSSVAIKKDAVGLFSSGQFAAAADKFASAMKRLLPSCDSVDEAKALKLAPCEVVKAYCALLNNRAACELKRGQTRTSIALCTRSLAVLDFLNARAETKPLRVLCAHCNMPAVLALRAKALLRRANGYESDEQHGSALRDLEVLRGMNPNMDLSALTRLRKQVRQEVRSRAMEAKERGNAAFGRRAFQEAIDRWSHALQLCGVPPRDDEDSACEKLPQGALLVSDPNLTSALLSNRAQAYIQLERFDRTVEDCTLALRKQPNNAKALFRRAMARQRGTPTRADLELCVADLEAALLIERKEANRAASSARIANELKEVRAAVARLPKEAAKPEEAKIEPSEVEEYTAPTNGYDFVKVFKRFERNLPEFARYLKCIPPSSLPKLFEREGSLDPEHLSGILLAMEQGFIREEQYELTLDWFAALERTGRFVLNMMLISTEATQAVARCFKVLEEKSTRKELVKQLRPKFSVQ